MVRTNFLLLFYIDPHIKFRLLLSFCESNRNVDTDFSNSDSWHLFLRDPGDYPNEYLNNRVVQLKHHVNCK